MFSMLVFNAIYSSSSTIYLARGDGRQSYDSMIYCSTITLESNLLKCLDVIDSNLNDRMGSNFVEHVFVVPDILPKNYAGNDDSSFMPLDGKLFLPYRFCMHYNSFLLSSLCGNARTIVKNVCFHLNHMPILHPFELYTDTESFKLMGKPT